MFFCYATRAMHLKLFFMHPLQAFLVPKNHGHQDIKAQRITKTSTYVVLAINLLTLQLRIVYIFEVSLPQPYQWGMKACFLPS